MPAAPFGQTIGVVLSRLGRNGTAGLEAIRRAGGKIVIQDPRQAECPSMPLHALETIGVPDLCGTATEIARFLRAIGQREGSGASPAPVDQKP